MVGLLDHLWIVFGFSRLVIGGTPLAALLVSLMLGHICIADLITQLNGASIAADVTGLDAKFSKHNKAFFKYMFSLVNYP